MARAPMSEHKEVAMTTGEQRYIYRTTRVMLVDRERRPCQVCGGNASAKIGGLAVCRACASRIFEACGERLMAGQRMGRQEVLRAARDRGAQ